MKIKEFKSFIREEIIATLSEAIGVELTGRTNKKAVTSFSDLAAANKFKQENPNIAKITPLEEDGLDEMAQAKVSYILNKEMKDELASLIEKAKGNVKKALEYLLEKGEMVVADVAKEFGLNDTASINNPKFRELMGMLKDKGVVSMGGAAPKAAVVKPSKEKIEKTVKAVEKDINTGEEETDNYYKAGDEDSAPDETSLDKQATQKANKLTKRTSELDINLKKKIKIEAEIQSLLNKYKKAEGDEKSNLAAKLSEKNKEKKENEALINKAIKTIGNDIETGEEEAFDVV